MTCLFYLSLPQREVGGRWTLDSQYDWRIWRPSCKCLRPAGMPMLPYVVWWLMHYTGLFRNRGYGVFVVYREGRLVHYSGIYPGYFRFPFMGKDDLQIGNTWTDPAHRGKGIAAFAIQRILESEDMRHRRCWYLTEEENAASVRAVVKAGMVLAGRGIRTKRFGLNLFGTFLLTEPLQGVKA